MSAIIPIIILLLGINLTRRAGEDLYNWLVFSLLFVYSSLLLLNKPHISSHYFFVLCSTFALYKGGCFNLKEIPFKFAWVIYIIGFLYIGFNSETATGFYKLYKPLSTFIQSYFILLIGFFGFRKINETNTFITNFLYVVTLYGIFCFLTHSDPIRSLLSSGYDATYYFGSGRTRIGSTWSHPIAYGLVCSIYSVLYLAKQNKSRKEWILIVLLILNMLISGSRTVLVSFGVMWSLYTLFANRGSKRVMSLSLAFFAVLSLYLTVPSINSKINDIVDSANGTSQTSGSSLEMRDGQFEASLAIASQFPMTGGGFDYIQEGLGYGNDIDDAYWMQYGELYGFESYIYELIIERGIIGIVIEIVLLLAMITWLFNHKKFDLENFSKAISILFGFLVFSIMTGTLDTWVIAFMYIGVFMGKIKNKSLGVLGI